MDLCEQGEDRLPLLVHIIQPPQLTTADDLPDLACHALPYKPQATSLLHVEEREGGRAGGREGGREG